MLSQPLEYVETIEGLAISKTLWDENNRPGKSTKETSLISPVEQKTIIKRSIKPTSPFYTLF